jgi:uracil-DNA glycosylase
VHSEESVSLRFNFGLVGKFEFHSKHNLPDACVLYFASSGDEALCLVDTMKGASYEIGTWGKDRGPCPLTQYSEFKQHIMDNLTSKDFDEEIGIVLLNQRYFNGIGNYLRAEILDHAHVDPFMKASEVFADRARLQMVLQLCHRIPQEVLENGLNKYGSPEEVKKFNNWLQCYGKKKSFKDKKGRTMWYDPNYTKKDPAPSLVVLPKSDDVVASYAQHVPKLEKLKQTNNITAKLLYMVSILYNDAKILSLNDRNALKLIILQSKTPPEWLVAVLQAFQGTKDFEDVVETLSIGLSIFHGPSASPSSMSDQSVSETNSRFLTQHLTDPSWLDVLSAEFEKPYFKKIAGFLWQLKSQGTQVFPPENEIFNAFNLTPFDKVKVVLLGQDPYHDDEQAHGLAFSVKRNIKTPPSLVNMYRELSEDIPGFKSPSHGNLEEWARQGVFLLNATLTVEAHKPNSHSNCGWQQFTDTVIQILSAKKSGLVFLLLGSFAQKKASLIDAKKHSIIQAAHPSPLSANKWFGCRVFSKTNQALTTFGHSPVDWKLSDL